MLKCDSCGFENNDRAVYCEKCGTGLWAQRSARYGPGASQVSRRRRRASGLAGGSFLGMIIGIVMIALGILAVLASFGGILGSAGDAGDDPLGMVGDILGGFGVMVLGAILIALGGIILFIGIVYVIFKVAG